MRIPLSFGHLSIRQKLMTLLVGLGCLTALAVSVPLGLYDYFSSRHAMARHLAITADILARDLTNALTLRDSSTAKQTLQALRAEPNVTVACIYAADGEVLAFYLRDSTRAITPCQPAVMPTLTGERDQLVEIRKIQTSGVTVGTLYIESDFKNLHSHLRGHYFVSLLTLVIVVALAFVVAERLQRPISHPLLELVRTAKTIADREDYSIRAHLPNQDEFGLLVSAFNGMLEQIEKRDRALCDYHEHLEEQVVARTAALSKANMQLALQAAALQAAANSIVITDREGKIVWTNSAFSAESGYSANEVIGKQSRILVSGEHDQTLYDQIWQSVTTGEVWRGEVTNRRKDGTSYVEMMSITPVRSDIGEIAHFVAIKQNITKRKQAEEALRQAEEKYRGMFEDAVVGIYRTTPSGKMLSANRALAQMCGFDSAEQLIASIHDIAADLYDHPQDRENFKRALSEHGVLRNFEHQIRRKDGSIVWLLHNARVVGNDQGEILFYEGTVHDVTERKALEDQLRQSQKMEAVGRLAGGVAHDFNNALGVIMGYGELLDLNLAPDSPMHKHAKEIIKAGQRAASLTRQLLAFSRKQTIQPVVLDLNSVVMDTEKMLQRLIGEDIDLTIVRESKLKSVKADRGQITQILMNLSVNSRDAMPDGGKLLIETANTELTEADARQYHFISPGTSFYCVSRIPAAALTPTPSLTSSNLFSPPKRKVRGPDSGFPRFTAL